MSVCVLVRGFSLLTFGKNVIAYFHWHKVESSIILTVSANPYVIYTLREKLCHVFWQPVDFGVDNFPILNSRFVAVAEFCSKAFQHRVHFSCT